MASYDIIGDIHGQASALEALLENLGYRVSNGAHRHPERQVIFVGDFIDRGPRQVDTVDIARRMVDAGNARAVMGNHELNAIAWRLEDPDRPGEHLRRHTEKNRRQHARFLAEVEGKPLHAEITRWFLTLPLWLELPGLKIVHASWHGEYVDWLRDHLNEGRLAEGQIGAACVEPEDKDEKDTAEPTLFKAVEAVTKGLEVQLPDGVPPFLDKDGHARDRVRVKWWQDGARTYRQLAILDEERVRQLPEDEVPAHKAPVYSHSEPVFFGHYWYRGTPAPLAANKACVDYSAGMPPGKLCAYRWDGEPELAADKFVWVNT